MRPVRNLIGSIQNDFRILGPAMARLAPSFMLILGLSRLDLSKLDSRLSSLSTVILSLIRIFVASLILLTSLDV